MSDSAAEHMRVERECVERECVERPPIVRKLSDRERAIVERLNAASR